jgi:hypothetical protein
MHHVRVPWARKAVAALLAVVLPTALLVLVSAAPANAASSYTFTIPAGTASLSTNILGVHVDAVKKPQTVADAVTCTVTVTAPLVYTGPLGTGEESVGYVQCNIYMYALEVEIGLVRNGTLVSYNYNTQYNAIQANVTTTYQRMSGQYMAEADAGAFETPTSTLDYFPTVFSYTVTL